VNREIRLRHNPLLAWREIDGSIIVISPSDSTAHVLNATASFVWEQLDGHKSLQEIAASMTSEFDVEFQAALADAELLAVNLGEKGLVLQEVMQTKGDSGA
jgi:hypothetical protein